MADWFIATEGVKVVKDSASLWPQIITAVTSIGAALGGVSLTHHYTRKREERSASNKAAVERLYIVTELVFLLERYANAWVPLHWSEIKERYKNSNNIPVLDLSGAAGDWRVLPSHQIFRIRTLEANHSTLLTQIMIGEQNDYLPIAKKITNRCYLAGLQAFLLAGQLRRAVGLPDSRQLTEDGGTFRKLRENRKEIWHWLVCQKRADKVAVKLLRDLNKEGWVTK
ncbi:hypothetical protein J1786_08005 [Rahnella sp. L72c]|uniref:Uncharacterized protein n=2 Tax=Rahnella perminowiae TaxID=2816244 RepID=A0ABS6KYS7_9GAMM|nr:hypothetical protein [Rahnella perminowiae]